MSCFHSCNKLKDTAFTGNMSDSAIFMQIGKLHWLTSSGAGSQQIILASWAACRVFLRSTFAFHRPVLRRHPVWGEAGTTFLPPLSLQLREANLQRCARNSRSGPCLLGMWTITVWEWGSWSLSESQSYPSYPKTEFVFTIAVSAWKWLLLTSKPPCLCHVYQQWMEQDTVWHVCDHWH